MRKVAILQNVDKADAAPVAQEIAQLLGAAAIEACRIEVDIHFNAADYEQTLQHIDMAFVLGGDGTLLGVARQLAPFNIPLLGINLGRVGFLTEAELGNIQTTVQRVIAEDYDLESRLMLEATVVRSGVEVARLIGLNDAGIGKGSFARMVTVDVQVDDVFMDTYRGDGVIVSTPTGSTAYSLSCGGPIIIPHLQAMLVTPICPHTLFSRPCVIDSNQTVTLTVHASHDDIGLTLDGQVGERLMSGDVIRVRKSPHQTTLVRWRDREFFTILRNKLHNQRASSV